MFIFYYLLYHESMFIVKRDHGCFLVFFAMTVFVVICYVILKTNKRNKQNQATIECRTITLVFTVRSIRKETKGTNGVHNFEYLNIVYQIRQSRAIFVPKLLNTVGTTGKMAVADSKCNDLITQQSIV